MSDLGNMIVADIARRFWIGVGIALLIGAGVGIGLFCLGKWLFA